MKLGEAIRSLQVSLNNLYSKGEAEAILALFIERLTGNRSPVLLQNEFLEIDLNNFDIPSWVSRIESHEPVQYILGEADFYHLRFYVNRYVLIPRSETEELVHWVINDVKKEHPGIIQKPAGLADQTDHLKILDIGTGSGCIPISLKNNLPLAEIWGCDISPEALTVARRNASDLDIRVDFQQVNILDETEQRQLPSVDIIISNPPYIPIADKESIPANVLDHEPHQALFVENDDPLQFYRAILEFSKKRLHPGGSIYLEIHEDYATPTAALFNPIGQVEIRKDMQGKERMIKITT